MRISDWSSDVCSSDLNLTRAERQVIDHLLRIAPSELAFVSAAGIAEATGTSDATVIRAARRLGFSGLPELKRQATRAIAARMPISRRLEQRVKVVGADIGKAREAVFAAAQEVLESTDEALDRTALDAAVSLLQSVETVWRSEERRGGEEGVSVGRTPVEPAHLKTHNQHQTN